MDLQKQQVLVEGSPIFLVPEIILEEKIFAFSENLKNLMLTCKYFRDVIYNSRQLMKKFELKILQQSTGRNGGNYNEDDVSTMLASKRKYSRIALYLDQSFDSKYLKLVQHLKDSLTKVTFHSEFNLLALADTLAAGVQEVNFSYCNVKRNAMCHVDFSKFERIKHVRIVYSSQNIRILNYLPETENLEVSVYKFDADGRDYLERYLRKQKKMTKFSVKICFGNFGWFPQLNIYFGLVEIEIHAASEGYGRPDNLINFFKSQAKTLKRLAIKKLLLDLDDIQNLIEPLEALECLEIESIKYSRSSLTVVKNFTCPKMRKVKLNFNDNFPLFNKFPSLEELEIGGCSDAVSVAEAAKDCHEIKKLVLRSFAGLHDAFFSQLVDLEIGMADGNIVEKFVLKHKTLERLQVRWNVNEALLKKVLNELPNLKYLKFSLEKTYGRKGDEYNRHYALNRQILRNIWPLFGNLKTLSLSGDGLDKYEIYEEFPLIPKLTIINF